MENNPCGFCVGGGCVCAGVDRPVNCDVWQPPTTASDGAKPVPSFYDGGVGVEWSTNGDEAECRWVGTSQSVRRGGGRCGSGWEFGGVCLGVGGDGRDCLVLLLELVVV